MVNKCQVLGIIGVIAMAGLLLARPAAAQDWTVAPPDGEVQASFDDTLSPYGDWVDVNGTRAWRPAASVVGEDFQPYASGGQWLYTDSGWYFQSDYPWGWAPFHYGRWVLDVNYGWIWVPGNVWAPAWVDWRIGGGYIGWAPLPPIGWSVVVQPWRPYWCFVPSPYFAAPNFWSYRLPVERVHYAYAATAPVHEVVVTGNTRWYRGPALTHVERVSSQPVSRVVGNFVPPAPGRVQPVHLNPPRGWVAPPRGSGAVTPSVARPPPGGGRPVQAPSGTHSVQPGRSAPPPVQRPSPHGYTPLERPSRRASGEWSTPAPARSFAQPSPPASTPSFGAPRSFSAPSAFAGPRGSSPSAGSVPRSFSGHAATVPHVGGGAAHGGRFR